MVDPFLCSKQIAQHASFFSFRCCLFAIFDCEATVEFIFWFLLDYIAVGYLYASIVNRKVVLLLETIECRTLPTLPLARIDHRHIFVSP